MADYLFSPALSFDGVDDKVEAGDVHDFAGTAVFAVECWVRFLVNPPVSTFRICLSKTDAAVEGYQLVQSNNIFYAERGTAVSRSQASFGNPTLSTWLHAAATYDSANLRSYLNGVFVTETASAQSLIDRTVPFQVGAASALGMFHSGQVDEVRVWNIVRSERQIRDFMHKRMKGYESGLVGYWALDEFAGLTAYDATANANKGTITGATWTTRAVKVPHPQALESGSRVARVIRMGDIAKHARHRHPGVPILRFARLRYWRLQQEELDVLRDFHGAMRGSARRFDFTNLESGETYKARFAKATFEADYNNPRLWNCELEVEEAA